MYIAEIAPTRLRGRLVTLYQLGIVLGILGAVFANMLIQRILSTILVSGIAGVSLVLLRGHLAAILHTRERSA